MLMVGLGGREAWVKRRAASACGVSECMGSVVLRVVLS